MSKNKYLSYSIAGILLGIFILPSTLDWLGVPFSFSNILYLIFGEPNPINKLILSLIMLGLLFFVFHRIYKEYKEPK